jgi:hypothetical protein
MAHGMDAAHRASFRATGRRSVRRVRDRAVRGATMATSTRNGKHREPAKAPARRVIAVGKWTGSKWLVRTTMWRYVTSYVISKS